MVDLNFFFILQAVFDLLLLFLVLLLYLQVRRLQKLPFDEIEKRLKTANELCERLSENIAQKKEISERIISALETGATAWESTRSDSKNIKERVRKLAAVGLSVPEIAKETGLQEGEVALILSVSKKK